MTQLRIFAGSGFLAFLFVLPAFAGVDRCEELISANEPRVAAIGLEVVDEAEVLELSREEGGLDPLMFEMPEAHDIDAVLKLIHAYVDGGASRIALNMTGALALKSVVATHLTVLRGSEREELDPIVSRFVESFYPDIATTNEFLEYDTNDPQFYEVVDDLVSSLINGGRLARIFLLEVDRDDPFLQNDLLF